MAYEAVEEMDGKDSGGTRRSMFEESIESNDFDFSQVENAVTAPKSDKEWDAIIALAVHEMPYAPENIARTLRACFQKGLFDAASNAILPQFTGFAYSKRVKAKLASYYLIRMLKYCQQPQGLEEIRRHIREALVRLQQYTDPTTSQKPYANKPFFVIYDNKMLTHLLEAHLARIKDHLLPRYRRMQKISAVLLATTAAVLVPMSILFVTTNTTLSIVPDETLHAGNWNLIICSALLSAMSGLAYAGTHALGSLAETALIRQMNEVLRPNVRGIRDCAPRSCFATVKNFAKTTLNNRYSFITSTLLITLVLMLSSQNLIYLWTKAPKFALGSFIAAILALPTLTPWGVQLYRDKKTEPVPIELPSSLLEEDLEAHIFPQNTSGMAVGTPQALLEGPLAQDLSVGPFHSSTYAAPGQGRAPIGVQHFSIERTGK